MGLYIVKFLLFFREINQTEKNAFLQQIINPFMRLIKNTFVRFWPATDNKHFINVCFQVLHQKLSKSGVLSVWEKH